MGGEKMLFRKITMSGFLANERIRNLMEDALPLLGNI